MYVVGIVHGKGGVGKSTIAVNLARSLQLRGADPVLIDCDQQGTSQDWKASNPDGDALPAVFAVSKPKAIAADVRKLSEAFDIAIIDGGAHLQALHVEIIKASDLVLIPVQPSPADIWPTEKIVEMIQARRSLTGAPDAAFVISRRKVGTSLGEGVTDVLERFELPVWAGTCDRVAYPEAMGRGLSVVELGDEKAAEEIRALADTVIQTLTHD